MIYQIKRTMQYIAKVYALIFMNALFIFCLCLTLTLVEKALKYKVLMSIFINLGLAVLPLLIWSCIYYFFFRNKLKALIYNSASQSVIAWFGYVALGATIWSIFQDLFRGNTQTGHFIPAGIVGKYFTFILQGDHVSSHKLSIWLIIRYIIVGLFVISYITSCIHFAKLQISASKGFKRIPIQNQSSTPTPTQKTIQTSKQLNPKATLISKETQIQGKKAQNNKKKNHRKKLHYIE